MGPSSGARLRAWFLRNLLDAAERELGVAVVAGLPERVPSRLRAHLSLERLRASAALDTLPLDEGEEAMLMFEQTLGDGSGRTLERVACEMLARQLVQAASAVRVGDLYGTVARLRAPLEHPFVEVSVQFELARLPTGFRLSIGIPGRPRATRLLGHLATGAIQAAERFARESHADPLRLEMTTFADRARVDAHFRRASTAPPPLVLPPSPLPAPRRVPPARAVPSLSQEVARILDSSLADAARAASEDATRDGPLSERPRPREAPTSVPPPAGAEPETQPPSFRERRPSRPPPGR